MVSTRLSFCKKTLPLVLIVFTVFTISLTENLQLADGFLSKSTAGWKYELSPGESQVGTWTLTNGADVSIDIEFRAEKQGSEFFTFEKTVTLAPKEKRAFEFIVTIPDDHPDNVKYLPELFALELNKATEGGASVVIINYQMVAHPQIWIGDNPIYTPPPEPEIIVEEEPEPVKEESSSKAEFTAVEEKPLETIAEKLARIAEANIANAPAEVQVDDTFEEEAVPELVVDDSYIEEPVDDAPKVKQTITQDKVECSFIDWLLSLFGMAKC